MASSTSFVALALCALFVVASAQDVPIVQQLAQSGYSGFANLIEHANMAAEIEAAAGAKGVTIFAPSDESLMYHISPALMAYLKAPGNEDTLRKVLGFHIVTEPISAFKWDGAHATLEGSSAVLRMDALAFYVANVAVKQYNAIIAEKAVVHSIRGLLIPASVEAAIGTIDTNVDEAEARRALFGVVSRMDMAGAPSPSVGPPAPTPSDDRDFTVPPPAGPKSAGRFFATAQIVLSGAAAVALALMW
jgi:uncharacterized surface protein with fasciclin (FAS1) repeats